MHPTSRDLREVGPAGRRAVGATLAAALVIGSGVGVLAHRATAGSGGTLTGAPAAAPQQSEDAADDLVELSIADTGRRPRVEVYECPGGEAVGHLAHLDRVVLTATHVDHDGWIRTRDPMSPNTAWWIRSEYVDPDIDLDTLPAVECLGSLDVAAFDELGAFLDDFEVFDEFDDDTDELDDTDIDDTGSVPDPETSTTTPGTTPLATTPPDTTAPPATTPGTTPPATTPPGGTTPGTAPATTAAPPTTAPAATTTTAPAVVTWGAVTRQHATIRENFPGACDTDQPTTSQISTSVSHPAGITSVEFRHRVVGGSWSNWQTVANQAGPVAGTVGPYAAGVAPPPDGSVTAEWEFRATPAQGSATTLSSTGQNQVSVAYCGLS